jgi:glucose-1-phosphate adenylyltransferase
VREAIISHGCTVEDSTVDRAVVGLRSHVGRGCLIRVRVFCL